jgi:hypothetical protein
LTYSVANEYDPRNVGLGLHAMHSARDLRRAREARVKYWRVLLVTTFFVVVLGGNLFVGAVLVSKALQTATTESPASFRIGRITFPLLDGVFCRHILIDNETAQPTKRFPVATAEIQSRVAAARGLTGANDSGVTAGARPCEREDGSGALNTHLIAVRHPAINAVLALFDIADSG